MLEEVYKENNMVVNIGSINSPNIFSNNNYYIYLNDFNDDINAIDNNWNTDSIEDMLYHYLDDNSLGKVIYLPETDISGKALLKNSFCHSDIKVDLLYSGNIIDSTYTDVYGNFSFNNILLNVYTLSFEYENYETVEQEIEVTNEGVEVNVELIYDFNLFDVNNDGILNEADLYSTAGYFGTSIEDDLWNVIYDFNRNGRIDILDLMMILRMGDE